MLSVQPKNAIAWSQPAGSGPVTQVGVAVGLNVLGVVGAKVGEALCGAPVGSSLGAIVGGEDCVGDPVGAAVGSFVGPGLGEDVGKFVGAAVGADVGKIVGIEVGSAVGPIVGCSELGTRVGTADGASVHALQCPGQKRIVFSLHPKNATAWSQPAGSGPVSQVGLADGLNVFETSVGASVGAAL